MEDSVQHEFRRTLSPNAFDYRICLEPAVATTNVCGCSKDHDAPSPKTCCKPCKNPPEPPQCTTHRKSHEKPCSRGKHSPSRGKKHSPVNSHRSSVFVLYRKTTNSLMRACSSCESIVALKKLCQDAKCKHQPPKCRKCEQAGLSTQQHSPHQRLLSQQQQHPPQQQCPPQQAPAQQRQHHQSYPVAQQHEPNVNLMKPMGTPPGQDQVTEIQQNPIPGAPLPAINTNIFNGNLYPQGYPNYCYPCYDYNNPQMYLQNPVNPNNMAYPPQFQLQHRPQAPATPVQPTWNNMGFY